jgi:hypothetical protein
MWKKPPSGPLVSGWEIVRFFALGLVVVAALYFGWALLLPLL